MSAKPDNSSSLTGLGTAGGVSTPVDPSDEESGQAQHPSQLAEEARRVSALAFGATSEGVVIADNARRIILVNPAFESITGYSQQEVAGRTCAFLQGPLTDTGTVDGIRNALQEHSAFSGEVLNYCKDGRIFWNDLSISPVRDADGSVTHFIGIMRDISERKRAEAALRESETRYRDAAEVMGGYILDIDTNFRYTFVSERAEKLLGYPSNELLGRTPAEFMPPGEIDRVNAWLEQHLEKDGSVHGLEHRIVTKAGAVLWLQVSRIPLHDSKGTLTGYRGTAFDITPRKQADAAQRESEARYRDAAEAAGGYICDLGADFRYTYVSEAAERMLGYTPEEMLGRTPAAFMPPGEIERVNACFEDYKKPDGSLYGLEYRVVTKSGSISWMQTSRIPLRDRQGAVTGYRGTSFDITPRKLAEASRAELETQLRESQKMQAIGTLAGGIAHDFNNIIAAILGNVALAREDASPASKAQESLEEIHKAASRARDLVKQILAFSRRQHTHYQQTALGPVIEETASMLRATLPARAAIFVQCAPNTPDVSADTSQMQQILINLATNAVQAMDGQPGQIDIRLDAVVLDDDLLTQHPSLREFHKQNQDAAVRLTFSDDGPGMSQAILARIFEPFFTTKPVGEGTGLGLSVVHGIVQGHKGVIVVNSEPGAGTQFTLYLPACPTPLGTASDQPPQDVKPATSPASPLAPQSGVSKGLSVSAPHILYLDDDEALVSLVKRLLERRGYRVSAHHDQQSALDAISADPAGIDLVLTDYNMPGMSGLDVARLAHAIKSDLPVAIASGFIDEKLSAQAQSAGINNLIFKASSVDEFCGAIEALLSARD
ncbi:PAS domain S-box protein [Hydrogenophaga sp.]|uniref:PAS domain-containing hybrid sensor histidine kinase/response regulator n=1 Tax=Hydrogenophaga sp. TaxID=1904254 RepID=UPI0025C20543|nr:PAS domain S-box protein [Hydrogenophaga sp.]